MPVKATARELTAFQMEAERRARRQREELAHRYDWYGDECQCGLPLGECREHPRARPQQRPPGSYRASSDRTDWRIWLMKAGRFFGKSRSAAEFINREVEAGRAKWVALVGATAGDVREFQIEHPYSGLVTVAPPWFKPLYEPSKRRLTWPNGAYATVFTAEEPEGLRGGGFNLAWVDELAKWGTNQQYTWDMLEFALREISEPRTRVVVTTTPRPTPTYFSVRDDPSTEVTGGKSTDNASNVDPDSLAKILAKYGGTRLGLQELEAHDDLDVPGALWNWAMFEGPRRPVPPGVRLARIVVAVDPSAGSQDPESAAECGIVVAGKGTDGHCYVLEDATLKASPRKWGSRAVECYRHHGADRIVAEINNGGDMVEFVLRTVAPHVPYKAVRASRGKQTRAEPVASLYERNLVHHCSAFGELERQLCSWDGDGNSPDRLDALVWAVTELMLGDRPQGGPRSGGQRRKLSRAGASPSAPGMRPKSSGPRTGQLSPRRRRR